MKSKFKVVRNQWDNLNGYVSGRKVVEFGTDRQAAREWLMCRQDEEREELRIDHIASMKEVV